MDISNLSPITYIPKPTEASALRSPRDRDSVYKLWQFVHKSVERCNQLSEIVKQQNRDIKRLQDRRVLDFDFFPFKLYNVPDQFRPQVDTMQYTASANWRTFRVRGGLVLTQFVSTGSFVNGTDGMQNYSYYNFYPGTSPATVGTYDIQVPLNTSQYWFWIEQTGSFSNAALSGSPYYLRYGSNPATASAPGNPNGWINFPSASVSTSGSYFPIGYVDTATSGSQNYAFVRQMQVGDVLSSGTNSGSIVGWQWVGQYNGSSLYSYQNVTIVQSGANQGMYVNISPTGSLGAMPSTSSVYPWQLIGLGLQATQICNPSSGVNETIYIQSTPP